MRNEEDEEWARAGKGAHVCDEETRLDDRAHPALASCGLPPSASWVAPGVKLEMNELAGGPRHPFPSIFPEAMPPRHARGTC